jgi:pimeloyl-ACP methyl ester carboxylesterase
VRVDEHTIAVGTTTPVFYLAAPNDGVPVLYLHGVGTNADDWTTLLERCGGIAPDLPGFGRSSKAGNLDYSLDGYATFIEQLLDELGVQTVRVVGHEWGAAFGLRFAIRSPDRGERVVLCNALPLIEGFRWPRLARAWRRPGVGELMMGCTSKRVLGRALRRGAADPSTWPEDRIEELWEQFDQGTQRAILRVHRSCSEQGLAEAGAELGGLDVQTLIIWGERDPWLPGEYAERLGRVLPCAAVQRFPEAGHWPWLERPSVVDRIAAFLE